MSQLAEKPLLQIIKAQELKETASRIALIHEFVVTKSLAPYLVSAAKERFLWIERPFEGGYSKTGIVRAAIRKDLDEVGFEGIYQATLEALIKRSLRYEYGNVCPPNKEGMREAVEYLRYYMLGPAGVPSNPVESRIEILASEDSYYESYFHFDEKVKYPIHTTSWLPSKTAIVVPEDRGYLGDLHLFGFDSYAVVVQNATRGIAMSLPRERYEEVVDDSSPSDVPDGGQ